MPVPNPQSPPPKHFHRLGHLLYTERLDGAKHRLYAVGFRFKDVADDPWTARFNRFKERDPSAVRSGVAVLQRALNSINFHGRRVLLGAISSSDTRLAADCPVHALCAGIAVSKKWEWPQEILAKREHTSLHSLKTAAERERQITGAYVAGVLGGPLGTVMIVDDFVTRGSTAAEIARAVLATNPGWKFTLVALGKNETVSYWNNRISNAHVPLILERTWESA